MVEAFIVLVLLGTLGYVVWKYRAVQRINAALSISDEEIQKTLVSGLYHRFKRKETNESDKEADQVEEVLEKESPFDFEDFVAQILQDYYGGVALSTQRSGDGGIDIIHRRDGELYFGQAKCYRLDKNVPFDPIAIVHSQMIKQGAVGGYVVTTSNFTPAAKQYAQELNANIELIDGDTLVRYWAENVEEKRNSKVPSPLPSKLKFW